MKPYVDVDEIIEHFTLLPPEINFLGRNDPHNQLGKALLLKFFQSEGRFPESENEFTPAIIEYVAQQLRLPPAVIQAYNWDGRTSSDQRNQIRELLGFHSATIADQEALRSWLIEEVLPHEHRPVYLEQLAYQHLQRQHIEPPTKGQVARLTTSALHQYEQSFFEATAARLSEETKAKLRQLIYQKEALATQTDLGEMIDDDPSRYLIHDLKSGPGDAKLPISSRWLTVCACCSKLGSLKICSVMSPCASCVNINSKWPSNPSATCNGGMKTRKPMRCWPPSVGCANEKSPIRWLICSCRCSVTRVCARKSTLNANSWGSIFVLMANSTCSIA
jgi:hypothetical protein